AVSPAVLRQVERFVGMDNEVVHNLRSFEAEGRGTDADGNREHFALELNAGRFYCLANPLSRIPGSDSVAAQKEHRKLLAAEPGDHISLPHRVPNDLADSEDNLVAGHVAVVVVEVLEPVDIDDEQP